MYFLCLLSVHVLVREVIARSLKAQTLAICTISAAKILCILFKHTCQNSVKATLILNCSKIAQWSVKMCFVISYKWFRNFHPSGLRLGSKISGLYFHFRVGRRKTESLVFFITWKITFSCFTLSFHGKNYVACFVSVTNDADRWLGLTVTKNGNTSFNRIRERGKRYLSKEFLWDRAKQMKTGLIRFLSQLLLLLLEKKKPQTKKQQKTPNSAGTVELVGKDSGGAMMSVTGKREYMTDHSASGYWGLLKSKGNGSFYPARLFHTFNHSLPCSTMFPKPCHPSTTVRSLLAQESLQNIRLLPSVLLLVVIYLGCCQPRSPVLPLFLSPYSSLISRIFLHSWDLSSSQVLHLLRIISFPRQLLTGILFSGSPSFQPLLV